MNRRWNDQRGWRKTWKDWCFRNQENIFKKKEVADCGKWHKK